MKIIIANGNQYITENNQLTHNLSKAKRFKETQADEYLSQNKRSALFTKMKVSDFSSNKNYVIISATKFVSYINGKFCTFTNASLAHEFNSLHEAKKYSYLLLKPYFIDVDKNVLINKSNRKNISHFNRKLVYKRCSGICQICGKPLSINEFTVDHIIPLSKGGSNEIDNLQATHFSCNQLKGQTIEQELYNTLTDILSYQINKGTSNEFNTDLIIRAIVRSKTKEILNT